MLTIQQRRRGWLAVHIIVAIYMFAALSTLCEEYFVPAIEVGILTGYCSTCVTKYEKAAFDLNFAYQHHFIATDNGQR